MFVQIFVYRFKSEEAKEEGIQYLKSTYIPNERKKFGFLDDALTDQENDVIMLLRYKVRENTYGKGGEQEGFAHFMTLLSERPKRFAGPNRILRPRDAQEAAVAESISAV